MYIGKFILHITNRANSIVLIVRLNRQACHIAECSSTSQLCPPFTS